MAGRRPGAGLVVTGDLRRSDLAPTATAEGKERRALAYHVASGKPLHDVVVFEVPEVEKKNRLNSYASPSCVVEPGAVYVHFGSVGTARLDPKTAKVVWQRRDLPCDHMEGAGGSPIIVDDMLVFAMDGGDVQYVIALDKATGKTRWRTPRSLDLSKRANDLRKGYNTPIVARIGDREMIISTGATGTYGYDKATGKERWRVRHPGFSMSSRTLARHGMLYINTGFMRPQLLAVKAEGEGDVTDEVSVWAQRSSVPTMPSPVIVGDLLFMVSDRGTATCLDARTGERHWRQRLGGSFSASPLATSDRVYFFDREGTITVVAAKAEFEKLAESRLEHGFMASPAVLGDSLILRTRRHLYRFGAEAQ